MTRVLRALEERLAQGVSASTGGGPARYDAALALNSVTNFYRGLKPGDITQAGGIFVATYRKLPPRGSRVGLRISLPGGVELEATGVVEWLREARAQGGVDVHPGFGARLSELPPDARGLIHQYTLAREPMLFDDA